MMDDDIVAGKGGFQKADLMDYGSLYGMGSYFGEDYTASTLVALGTATRTMLRWPRPAAVFELPAERQASAPAAMPARSRAGSDRAEVVVPARWRIAGYGAT